MVLKTREKLIDVARQLFAHKGVENTTMNDIATASDKGRRTIYTYFKSKREIYDAIVEQESEKIVQQLRDIVALELSPVDKLRLFLEKRFEIFKIAQNSQHPNAISAWFSRDFKRVERVKKLAAAKETEMLETIVNEGIAQKAFLADRMRYLRPTMALLLQGVDLVVMRNNFSEIGVDRDTFDKDITQFIIESIRIN